MKAFIIFLLSTVVIVGCKNGAKTSKTGAKCKQLTVVAPDVSVEPSEGIEVVKAYLKGKCLMVRVKYNGCEKTDFNLVHNGKVKKSLPPQVTLVLQKNEITCGTLADIETEYCYNIDGLQSISESGKVVIRLANYSEVLVYEY